MIYHVVPESEWRAAEPQGSYAPASLAAEGFVHCCRADQLAGVLERYFQGRTGLLLLHLDPARLTAELREEYSPPGGDVFPHVYGPINAAAVVAVEPLPVAPGS